MAELAGIVTFGGFACDICRRVFHKKEDLNTHVLTCTPVPKDGSKSFSNQRIHNKNPRNDFESENGEKFLPPSQPPTREIEILPVQEATMVEDVAFNIDILSASQAHTNPTLAPTQTSMSGEVPCPHCNRMFKSRGLNKHINSCKKKSASIVQHEGMISNSQNQTHQNNTPGANAINNIPIVAQEATNPDAVWGSHTYVDLNVIVSAVYEEIVKWKKNLFKLPSGNAGKNYIQELTRLIEIWNADSKPMSDIAIKLSMIMPAILLQKPSRKSTAKQHGEYLRKRLDLWKNGQFDQLMIEARLIQKDVSRVKPNFDSLEHLAKTFTKLMWEGRVNAALRLLDREASLGIAELTGDTMNTLRKLHPTAKEASNDILMTGDIPFFDPIIFTNINEKAIATAALKTRGGAGPSGQDADGWRRMLVSKNYGTVGRDLRTAIAKMTHALCTREINLIENTERK